MTQSLSYDIFHFRSANSNIKPHLKDFTASNHQLFLSNQAKSYYSNPFFFGSQSLAQQQPTENPLRISETIAHYYRKIRRFSQNILSSHTSKRLNYLA